MRPVINKWCGKEAYIVKKHDEKATFEGGQMTGRQLVYLFLKAFSTRGELNHGARGEQIYNIRHLGDKQTPQFYEPWLELTSDSDAKLDNPTLRRLLVFKFKGGGGSVESEDMKLIRRTQTFWILRHRCKSVPPPKPHTEALLRKAAKELPRLLIHKPFNPYCEVCNQAKLCESPHRKGIYVKAAEKFGDATAGGFIDSERDPDLREVGGFKDALNLRDLETGVKTRYPTMGRSEGECDRALRMFGVDAGKSRIQRFYSDTESGLVAAVKKLGIMTCQSQPGLRETNSPAERCNQDILGGTRALLAAAGLKVDGRR